jgi:hypothetical protein
VGRIPHFDDPAICGGLGPHPDGWPRFIVLIDPPAQRMLRVQANITLQAKFTTVNAGINGLQRFTDGAFINITYMSF